MKPKTVVAFQVDMSVIITRDDTLENLMEDVETFVQELDECYDVSKIDITPFYAEDEPS